MHDFTRNVIIGNSAAGLSALEVLRNKDPDCEITVISREKEPAYSLVLLPHFICGKISKSGLMIADDRYYRDLKVATIFGKRAVSIDTRNQIVFLHDGAEVPYDNLIICTGASSTMIDVEGSQFVTVKTLRTLEDALEIRNLLQTAKKVLLIGAGLVNLKLLSFLKDKGFEFTVVEMADKILVNMLDETAASIVEHRIQEAGVNLYKEVVVERIEKGSGSKPFAVLDNGLEIETDVVIFNTGISPNIACVNSSNIKTNKGIMVDNCTRTNIPNVYAAGDVAEVKERISGQYANIGNWFNAVEQGKTAAFSIQGKNHKYEGCLNINVTDLFDVTLLSLGDFNGTAEGSKSIIHSDLERGHYQKVILQEGRITGGVFVGEKRNGGVLKSLLGEQISDLKSSRIAGFGGIISFGQLINATKMKRRN